MLTLRSFVAILSTFVLAHSSCAEVLPLATVTHAWRAHIGSGSASLGSTVYESDRLSAEPGGVLRLSSPGLSLQLDGPAELGFRRQPDIEGNPGGTVELDLAAGALILSAGARRDFTVMADDAFIRNDARVATVAHVMVVNPKELRIYAQRGVLQFSYHGDSAEILEGRSYRVLLDPPDDPSSPAPAADDSAKEPRKHRRTFLLVALGVAAGVAIPVLIHAFESPDKPGR